MRFIRQIRRLFGQRDAATESPTSTSTMSTAPTPPPTREEVPEPVVQEISCAELREALAGAQPPVVLDVRESYEWRQVRLVNAVNAQHIPMNELPDRIRELDPSRRVIVMCAHGMRSYSVAAWLGEQGIDAASLRGGITEWASEGGPVEQGDGPR